MAWHDRILIIGGGGFVGGELARYLSQQYPTSYLARVDPSTDGWHYSRLHNEMTPTVTAYSSFDLFNFCPTAVFNCACTNQAVTQDDPATGYSNNVHLVSDVVNSLRSTDASVPFIQCSSASVYDNLLNENPSTEYGKQKLAADAIALLYKNTSLVRLTNVFGPGMKLESPHCGLIGKVALNVTQGTPLVLTDTTTLRTYTHIDDVVRVLEFAAEHSPTHLNAFNGWTATPVQVAGVMGATVTFGEPRNIDGVSRDVKALTSWYPMASQRHTTFETALQGYLNWLAGA